MKVVRNQHLRVETLISFDPVPPVYRTKKERLAAERAQRTDDAQKEACNHAARAELEELRRLRGPIPEPERHSIKPRRRAEIARTFQLTCVYCLRSSQSDRTDPDGHSWEIDHHTPVIAFGEHITENLLLSCRRCNRRKGRKIVPRGAYKGAS